MRLRPYCDRKPAHLRYSDVPPRQLYVNRRRFLAAGRAATVDTVGRETLTSTIRALVPTESVAACGLTGGPTLNTTMFPLTWIAWLVPFLLWFSSKRSQPGDAHRAE